MVNNWQKLSKFKSLTNHLHYRTEKYCTQIAFILNILYSALNLGKKKLQICWNKQNQIFKKLVILFSQQEIKTTWLS